MPHNGSYRSTEEFKLATDGLFAFCGMLLFEFAKQQCDTKNLILRNLIARTAVSVRGIMQLWLIGDVQDCWVLHRCLMDRLFHLRHLGSTKEYELFDDWSFYQQFNALSRVRSDQEFGAEHRTPAFSPTPEQKARYEKLSKNPPQFKTPEG